MTTLTTSLVEAPTVRKPVKVVNEKRAGKDKDQPEKFDLYTYLKNTKKYYIALALFNK